MGTAKPRLRPYHTSYHRGNAYWMARLARAVYAKQEGSHAPDEQGILADLSGQDAGFKAVTGFDRRSAQAIVVDHDDYVAIVFRGTDEARDWLDNLDVRPESALFGRFHRGFHDSVEDLWRGIDATVYGMLSDKRRPVWFAGHSLGGAMATIGAAKYVEADRPFSGVYTFGQPRCMGRKTSRIFNSEAGRRHYRFQNNNDLVTRVPTRLAGYSHVGRCIYISEERELHDSPGRWFRFLDMVDGALAAVKESGLDAIEDHDMEKYLTAIEDWGKKPLKTD